MRGKQTANLLGLDRARIRILQPLRVVLSHPLLYLLLAAASLRLVYLGSIPQVLWFDEITAYYYPYLLLHGEATAASLSFFHTSNLNGPYVAIASILQGGGWTAAITTTNTALIRIPAVTLGLGVVLLSYLLAYSLFGRTAGLTAGVLAAVSPWTLFYSRFMDPIASLEFWTLLSLTLLVYGYLHRNRAVLLGSVISGSFVVYTHLAGVAVFAVLFVPAWCWVAWELHDRGPDRFQLQRLRRVISNGLLEISISLLILLPALAFLFFNQSSALNPQYFVWQLCGRNTACLLDNVATRIGWSWSPDFLALTGGLQNAQSAQAEPHQSAWGVWASGGGFTGVLTLLGLLVYPALVIVGVDRIRRRTRRARITFVIVSLTALTYCMVGGAIINDNPNTGRLAFAVGPFIVLVAMALVRGATAADAGIRRIISRQTRGPVVTAHVSRVISTVPKPADFETRSHRTTILSLACALLVILAAAPYLDGYFTKYPAISASEFGSGISTAADILSHDGLWNNRIVVMAQSNFTYVIPGELSFYDPIKPPKWPIVSFNGSLSSNIDLLENNSSTVLISLIGDSSGLLASNGVAFSQVASTGQVSVAYVYGASGSRTPLSTIAGWTGESIVKLDPLNGTWTIQHASVNVTVRSQGEPNGTLTINASMSDHSSRAGWWAMTLTNFPTTSLAYHYMVAANWLAASSASAQIVSTSFEATVGNKSYALPAHLDYPGDGLNLLPSMPNPGAMLTAVTIGSNLLPGGFVNVSLGGYEFYSISPTVMPECNQTPSALSGSIFDIAVPAGNLLDFNDVGGTLNVSFCVQPSSGEVSTPVFFVMTFQTIYDLSRPMYLNVTAIGHYFTVVSGGGSSGQFTSLSVALPSNQQSQVNWHTSLTFSGRIVIREMGVYMFP
jgi:4-amino-4-deoxy-L-arabinose transferase-like glycosyltransferase